MSKVNGQVGKIETNMMQQRLKRMEEAKQERQDTPAGLKQATVLAAAFQTTPQQTPPKKAPTSKPDPLANSAKTLRKPSILWANGAFPFMNRHSTSTNQTQWMKPT